tara:strand:+ start:180 stop:674 length:495 start_codon:yes stop_codon:yes gene_type:complete
MVIVLKNKYTLQVDDFNFKCSIGKNGLTKRKIEGDKKTPRGIFNLGKLYFRKDRLNMPQTAMECCEITKNMGWCYDFRFPKKYNKLIKIKKKIKCEKLSRHDHKYDLLIPINYNIKNTIVGKGSAIFIHLTNNYKPTAGCIALNKKDFVIMLKLIKKKTKIKII